MSNKNIDDIATVSRRGFLKLAGACGLATAAGSEHLALPARRKCKVAVWERPGSIDSVT
jgi:hypothetical protein